MSQETSCCSSVPAIMRVNIVAGLLDMKRLRYAVLLIAMSARAAVLPPGIYPFHTYGTESGLGNLSVMRLAQDPAGSSCVGTDDAVSRYHAKRCARHGLGP